MTGAKNLGRTTVSMLRAEQGRQVKELQRLLEWLGAQQNKPDLVCLSNALLAGLAGPLKKEMSVPVVCLLQDEDGFLDGLAEPYRSEAWSILEQRCKDIDAFISVSRFYAKLMKKKLGIIEDNKVHVIYMGIPAERFEPIRSMPPRPGRRRRPVQY